MAIFSAISGAGRPPQQAAAVQKDPTVLNALQQQRQILHTGVFLNFEGKWAVEQGVVLTVSEESR